MDHETGEAAFRVAFVAGVTLTKWSRVWDERHPTRPLVIVGVNEADPAAVVRDGRADVVFARLPIERSGLSAIPLYQEQAVAVMSTEHDLAALETLVAADLVGQARLDLDSAFGGALAPAEAVQVAQSGAGVAVLPHSLARLYGRKGVVARPVTDVAPTTIALVWLESVMSDDLSDFIGIVRGRTANSSRGRPSLEPTAPSKRSTQDGTSDTTRIASQSTRSRAPRRGRGAPRRRG